MIAYLPKEKLTFNIRENSKDDKDVLWEAFGENTYRLDIEKLGTNKIMVDIGANIGAVAIKACSLVEGVTVIAIEPEPHNLELLRENINANAMKDLIHVYPVAIADSPTVTMSNNAGSSTSTAYGEIEAISLQELMDKIRHNHSIKLVDFLKVDIEGGEYAMFKGVSADRLKCFAYIAMEFHGTTSQEFGELVATLSRTHTVDVVGSYETGGQIYAKRY